MIEKYIVKNNTAWGNIKDETVIIYSYVTTSIGVNKNYILLIYIIFICKL